MWYKRCESKRLAHNGGPRVTPETIPQTVLFPELFDKPLVAAFDREHASSDGGAVLLKAAERVYGLVETFCRMSRRPARPVEDSAHARGSSRTAPTRSTGTLLSISDPC